MIKALERITAELIKLNYNVVLERHKEQQIINIIIKKNLIIRKEIGNRNNFNNIEYNTFKEEMFELIEFAKKTKRFFNFTKVIFQSTRMNYAYGTNSNLKEKKLLCLIIDDEFYRKDAAHFNELLEKLFIKKELTKRRF